MAALPHQGFYIAFGCAMLAFRVQPDQFQHPTIVPL
jgi:hypothetical protein